MTFFFMEVVAGRSPGVAESSFASLPKVTTKNDFFSSSVSRDARINSRAASKREVILSQGRVASLARSFSSFTVTGSNMESERSIT